MNETNYIEVVKGTFEPNDQLRKMLIEAGWTPPERKSYYTAPSLQRVKNSIPAVLR